MKTLNHYTPINETIYYLESNYIYILKQLYKTLPKPFFGMEIVYELLKDKNSDQHIPISYTNGVNRLAQKVTEQINQWMDLPTLITIENPKAAQIWKEYGIEQDLIQRLVQWMPYATNHGCFCSFVTVEWVHDISMRSKTELLSEPWQTLQSASSLMATLLEKGVNKHLPIRKLQNWFTDMASISLRRGFTIHWDIENGLGLIANNTEHTSYKTASSALRALIIQLHKALKVEIEYRRQRAGIAPLFTRPEEVLAVHRIMQSTLEEITKSCNLSRLHQKICGIVQDPTKVPPPSEKGEKMSRHYDYAPIMPTPYEFTYCNNE